MKRIVWTFCIAGLVMMAGTLTSVWAGKAVATAPRLIPAAKPIIDAQLFFLDTDDPSTGLIVAGEGKGFNPNNTYVSLIYDPGAVAGGPTACQPTSGILNPTQMLVGFWSVASDGSGTLFAIKVGDSFASLSDVGTVSIREVQGPPPAGFVLQACGEVVVSGKSKPERKTRTLR